jgi:hypothetical protein
LTGSCSQNARSRQQGISRLRPATPGHTSYALGLTDCLPETVRRRDELYNDYLLKGGVDDILGVRLFENATHVVMLGVIGARLTALVQSIDRPNFYLP